MSEPNCKKCDNSNCFINKYCNTQTKSVVNQTKTTIHVRQNQRLIFEGSTVLGIHFIYKGRVKVFKSYADKSEQIMRLAKSGDILGHRGYSTDKKYPISADAMSDTIVCFVPTENFLDTLRNNPELTYALMTFYAEELKKAEIKIYDLMRQTVICRLARAIIEIAEVFEENRKENTVLDVPISKKDLANMAVTRYETTLRCLSELEKKRLIKIKGKRIHILDKTGLKNIASHIVKTG